MAVVELCSFFLHAVFDRCALINRMSGCVLSNVLGYFHATEMRATHGTSSYAKATAQRENARMNRLVIVLSKSRPQPLVVPGPCQTEGQFPPEASFGQR